MDDKTKRRILKKIPNYAILIALLSNFSAFLGFVTVENFELARSIGHYVAFAILFVGNFFLVTHIFWLKRLGYVSAIAGLTYIVYSFGIQDYSNLYPLLAISVAQFIFIHGLAKFYNTSNVGKT